MTERTSLWSIRCGRSPGFRVQQLGGFGKTANIKTRGLRNQDTAVLIDGIRFRDPTAITGDASPFLSDFTLTSVARSRCCEARARRFTERMRSAGSSIFRLPSRKKAGTDSFPAPQAVLGLGRFRGNVSNGTSDGKFGFNAGVSRTVYTKGIDGDDDANNTNLQSRIEFRPTSKTNLSGRFFFSDAFVRLNSSPDTTAMLPASNFGIIDAREGVNFIPDVDDPDDTQKSRFFRRPIGRLADHQHAIGL